MKTGSSTYLKKQRIVITEAMRQLKYQDRFYRRWVKADGLVKSFIAVEETDLMVLSKGLLDLKFLRRRVKFFRRQITGYIAQDRHFAVSLKPVQVKPRAPAIVKMMSRAASRVNVGPMAAVAGCISEVLTKDLLRKGEKEIIIENGGDIYLSRQKRVRVINIFAGASKFSSKLSLVIYPQQTPCGVCASSGSFGHSLSFGNADSVVIAASSAAIADAAATAVCNLVKSRDDFEKAIGFAKKIREIFGVLIILDGYLAAWGKIEINKN